MKKILHTLLLLSSCLLMIFLFSCNSEKNLQKLVYLNDSTINGASAVGKKESLIQPGDRLNISVSAFNPASAAPYNIGGGVQGTQSSMIPNAASGTGVVSGYLVRPDGTIQFPQFGALPVIGKSLLQLTNELTTMLQKFVTDPMVAINFVNYKVTVLGEVGRPGPIPVPDGNLNIIEAVGLAGDLTISGRRDNILIIRETNGKREFGRVNLLSKNIFNSPYYYLQQNDVVYVQLDKNKANSTNQDFTRGVSVAATVLSIVSTITFLIITITR